MREPAERTAATAERTAATAASTTSETRTPAASTAASVAAASKSVVVSPLALVRKNFVSLRDAEEMVFGFSVARICVGVILLSQPGLHPGRGKRKGSYIRGEEK